MAALPANRDNRMIAVRFVGGARNGQLTLDEFACRDGFGAMVTADLGDMAIKREHRCGEGFATQHSATMVIGIGKRESVPALSVRWPSGKEATAEDIPAGSLLIAYEDELRIDRRDYPRATPEPTRDSIRSTKSIPVAFDPGAAQIHIFTTTATWCEACLAHLPELRQLAAGCEDGTVALWGIPTDPSDDSAKLAAYLKKWNPPYRLLSPSADEIEQLNTLIAGRLGQDSAPLPSTIIADAAGRIIEIGTGVPSLSRIREALGKK